MRFTCSNFQVMNTSRDSLGNLIRRCVESRTSSEGKLAHAYTLKYEQEEFKYLGNDLIEMYLKCHDIVSATQVLETIPNVSMRSWNRMVGAYAQLGDCHVALHLLGQMCLANIVIDKVTLISTLVTCTNRDALPQGKLIHAHVVESRLEADLIVGTVIINMYRKCHTLKAATSMFDRMPTRNVVSWTSMIGACAENGDVQRALSLFQEMNLEGVMQNKITFIAILDAVCMSEIHALVKFFHALLLGTPFEGDVTVRNALVNTYVKCGSLKEAYVAFDTMVEWNVISWTCMLGAYAKYEHGEEALQLFKELHSKRMPLDTISFINVLSACSTLGVLADGKLIHSFSLNKVPHNDIVFSNALIDMYTKCGAMEDACMTFHKLAGPDLVSWNCIIAAYAQNGHQKEAIEMFRLMEISNLKPDMVSFISLTDACCNLVNLVMGKRIHVEVIDRGLLLELPISNALILMYGKCGSLEDVHMVFDNICRRDLLSWNSVVAAYAQHGCARETANLFTEMLLEGVQPDNITFVSILSACSRAGFVSEGYKYFFSMRKDYGVVQTPEHYGCMIDLLCRTGKLDEAEAMLPRAPIMDNPIVWSALFSASSIHGDIKRAKRIANFVIEQNQQNAGGYLILTKCISHLDVMYV